MNIFAIKSYNIYWCSWCIMLEGGINGIVTIMILWWRHVQVCVCVCVLGGRGCVGAPAHLIGSFQRSLTVLHHCTEHNVWILQHQSLHRLLVHLVTAHQTQVPQRLAAPGDLSGALISDLLTPAGVHRLNSAAVLTDGDQSSHHSRCRRTESSNQREN